MKQHINIDKHWVCDIHLLHPAIMWKGHAVTSIPPEVSYTKWRIVQKTQNLNESDNMIPEPNYLKRKHEEVLKNPNTPKKAKHSHDSGQCVQQKELVK